MFVAIVHIGNEDFLDAFRTLAEACSIAVDGPALSLSGVRHWG